MLRDSFGISVVHYSPFVLCPRWIILFSQSLFLFGNSIMINLNPSRDFAGFFIKEQPLKDLNFVLFACLLGLFETL